MRALVTPLIANYGHGWSFRPDLHQSRSGDEQGGPADLVPVDGVPPHAQQAEVSMAIALARFPATITASSGPTPCRILSATSTVTE